MMTFSIPEEAEIPLADASVFGRNGEMHLVLVLDSGAAATQLNTTAVEMLGYSARDAIGIVAAHGPSGRMDQGYALQVDRLEIFGKTFQGLEVAAYDFTHFEDQGIDGLLGFDLIRRLRLELDGPKNRLTVY